MAATIYTYVYNIIHMSKRFLGKDKVLAEIKELKILGPFLSDYRTRYHGRQLAALLEMNHATTAVTLLGLEEKNILRSELEGRNKKYYLNMDNFLTRKYISDAESAITMKFIEKGDLKQKKQRELNR